MRRIDCDFLACSAYKFYGPHVGVLYGRRERVEALDVPKLAPAPDSAPERLETGTLNHEGIVGAGAAVDFLASLAAGTDRPARLRASLGALHERGRALLDRLWTGLEAIGGVTLYGPPPGRPRTPTIAFTVAGTDVRRGRFGARGRGACSCPTATSTRRRWSSGSAWPRPGLVRAGCACYTTADEVDRLIAGVRALAG